MYGAQGYENRVLQALADAMQGHALPSHNSIRKYLDRLFELSTLSLMSSCELQGGAASATIADAGTGAKAGAHSGLTADPSEHSLAEHCDRVQLTEQLLAAELRCVALVASIDPRRSDEGRQSSAGGDCASI